MTVIRQVAVPDMHVTPVTASDEPMHVLDWDCWCQPVIDYTDPVTEGRVWVHRRTLDSPHYEARPVCEHLLALPA